MADKGWIKVERALLDTFIWDFDQPFDDRSAYIDLRLRANYTDKDFRAKKSRDVIHVHENELMTSIGNLAERWHWSKDKVRRYLKMLEDGGFVKVVPYTCGTIIKLENIGIAGDGANDDKTANKTAYKYRHEYDHKDDGKTSNESRLKKERKDKKEKNQKNQEAAQRPADCYRWEGEPE